MDASTQGWGTHMGNSEILGTANIHINCLELNCLDPFPVLVTSSSGSLCVATSSEHSSKSQTHSRLFEHDSKLPIQAQSANNDRVESPFRNRDLDIRGLGYSDSGHVCHSPQYLPSSVHVSDSRATSTDGRCSISGLAGEVNVHVSAFPLLNKVIQNLCAVQEAEVILIALWWPSQLWFPHLL